MHVIVVGGVCIMCTVGVRKVIVILWIYVNLCIHVLIIKIILEVGSGYRLHEHSKRPADVLAANRMLGKPAASDFTVTSPLVPNSLPEASVTAGICSLCC